MRIHVDGHSSQDLESVAKVNNLFMTNAGIT